MLLRYQQGETQSTAFSYGTTSVARDTPPWVATFVPTCGDPIEIQSTLDFGTFDDWLVVVQLLVRLRPRRVQLGLSWLCDWFDLQQTISHDINHHLASPLAEITDVDGTLGQGVS